MRLVPRTRIRRRIFLISVLLVGLLGIGTTGFVLIEGFGVFDSFYMTLITIATVGYAEVPRTLDTAGRVFNSVLIVFGVSTMFFAIGAMTQTIVEAEFGEAFGRRRTKRMIDKLDRHYIICGFGRVGRSAAGELRRAGARLVVVERNPDRVEQAIRGGLLAVHADATRDETLTDVGVTRASGLVASLSTDADNLLLILSAKTLNPMLNVAARAGEEEAEQKLRRAGADTVFAPSTHAGHQLALSLVRPHVVHFLDVATKQMGLDVVLEQLRVDEGSEFASKSLKQMQFRRDLGVIVLAIRKGDGKMQFNPPADAVIEGGDYLIVMGEHDDLRKLESLLAGVRGA